MAVHALLFQAPFRLFFRLVDRPRSGSLLIVQDLNLTSIIFYGIMLLITPPDVHRGGHFSEPNP